MGSILEDLPTGTAKWPKFFSQGEGPLGARKQAKNLQGAVVSKVSGSQTQLIGLADELNPAIARIARVGNLTSGDIKALQQSLCNAGYGVCVSGEFDGSTKEALNAYLNAHREHLEGTAIGDLGYESGSSSELADSFSRLFTADKLELSSLLQTNLKLAVLGGELRKNGRPLSQAEFSLIRKHTIATTCADWAEAKASRAQDLNEADYHNVLTLRRGASDHGRRR